MEKTLSVNEIRKRLYRRDLKELAEESGLHYNTVRIFMQEGSNPTWRVIKALSELAEQD